MHFLICKRWFLYVFIINFFVFEFSGKPVSKSYNIYVTYTPDLHFLYKSTMKPSQRNEVTLSKPKNSYRSTLSRKDKFSVFFYVLVYK